MHKHVGKVAGAVILGVLVFVPRALDALFAFLFIGIVPNTNYLLPASVMLAIDAFLLAIAVYAIVHQLSIALSPVKRDLVSREKARGRVLRQIASRRTATTKSQKKYLPITEH